ncbi:hypothetical protein AALO_G00003040 [Alosa alosa]|uniref:Immunoglobulin V-set domain-containing protein n=1 Tax=Alosa alosa TaxID=278164 RepID=A0AAV6HGM8_9TELE|nr:hypothetical protein AALO_G00003040 [Alosa alosa]
MNFNVYITLLISIGQAASMFQQKVSVTKPLGKSVVITCVYTTGCRGNYIHWYQKKDGESFQRMLYIDADDGST